MFQIQPAQIESGWTIIFPLLVLLVILFLTKQVQKMHESALRQRLLILLTLGMVVCLLFFVYSFASALFLFFYEPII